MKSSNKTIVFGTFLLCFSALSFAAPEDFKTGPVLKNHGENAIIEGGLSNPEKQSFKVVFDIAERDKNSGKNRGFNTVARFINMHVRAGVPLENIEVAMVVHGKASFDLMNDGAHKAKFETPNPSSEVLSDLLGAKVKVYLCGQSASYHGIEKEALNPGVEMSLSAMTANALLQQQGFTLNPF